jgi:hypothetical protein
MRDVLLARIQPLVDRMAADITELAVRRVEAELERMGEAFAVALSAYASDAAPDMITKALGPDIARMLDTAAPAPPRPRPLTITTAEQADELLGPGTAMAARVKDLLPRPVVVPLCTPVDGQPTDIRRASNGARLPTCKLCGYVGGNARGCGRSHVTRTAAPSSPAPATPAPDRRAAIAALASKPKADAPIAVAGDDEDDEAWPASRIKEETTRAEGRKHKGQLPEPRSSFRIDGDDVTELDFGRDCG